MTTTENPTNAHGAVRMTARGIRATVYRSAHHSPNGGISARADSVILTGPGIPQRHPVTDREPEVTLTLVAGRHLTAQPADGGPAGSVGPMASGATLAPEFGDREAFAATTGGRDAIPLHDRYETVAEYARFSA